MKDDEIEQIEKNVKNQELEIQENEIPVITCKMLAQSSLNDTKRHTNLDIGCVMERKDIEDGKCYLFIGLLDESHIPDDDLTEVIQNERVQGTTKRRLGWFAEFPIKPKYRAYESEVPIYAWYVDLFEKV